MDQKLRLRILRKLAQTTTQTTAPSTTSPPVGSPPAIPTELMATLTVGYNPDTVTVLKRLLDMLNKSLHYASNGEGNYAKIKTNNYDPNDAHEPAKNIGLVAEQLYTTFFNNGNAHTGQYEANQITTWCDTVLGSTAYNDLATIKPNSALAPKLQSATGGGSLKDAVRRELEAIKKFNPVTS